MSEFNSDIDHAIAALHALKFWRSHYASSPPFHERKRDIASALREADDNERKAKGIRTAIADAIEDV